MCSDHSLQRLSPLPSLAFCTGRVGGLYVRFRLFPSVVTPRMLRTSTQPKYCSSLHFHTGSINKRHKKTLREVVIADDWAHLLVSSQTQHVSAPAIQVAVGSHSGKLFCNSLDNQDVQISMPCICSHISNVPLYCRPARAVIGVSRHLKRLQAREWKPIVSFSMES